MQIITIGGIFLRHHCLPPTPKGEKKSLYFVDSLFTLEIRILMNSTNLSSPLGDRGLKPATKYIHAGAAPDPSTGAIMTPIYQTSTYVQEAPGVNKGFEYARSQNPTRKALEEALAIIENGKFALAFSSGVAATDAVIKLLSPDDEVICGNDMYGGSYRLFTKVWERYGIKFIYVDTTDAANVKTAVTAKTKLVWLETPTNPLMNISDIAAIATISKQAGALLCVDNTFASQYQKTIHWPRHGTAAFLDEV